MGKFVQKQNQARKGSPVDPAKSRKVTPKSITDEHPILQLQRTIGNQAVLRLLRSQGLLRSSTGAAADGSEQEAGRNVPQVDHIHEAASKGVAGPSAPLPHLDAIQRSFGKHDVSSVEAHVGPQATDANQAIDAVGYATGNHVAFSGAPDLHTAAHEAAHVVQQRSGVQLSGGAGRAGDAYETHADAVAELVVNGEQAGPLLDQTPGYAGRHGEGAAGAGAVQKSDQPVQMQGAHKQTQTTQPAKTTDPKQPPEDKLEEARRERFQQMLKEWALMDEIKAPVVHKLTEGYLNRPGRVEIPDKVIPDTPYGGAKVKPGVHDPSYNDVYNALYNAIDLKKTGKGYSATDWEWRDAPAKKKTRDEKSGEIGAFVTDEFVQDKIQNAVIKTSVTWASQRALSVGLTLSEVAAATASTLFAIEIIGFATLVLGVNELLMSLNEPAELSPYQQKNANIVSSVKAWLQGKQEAAALKESLSKPFKVEIDAVRDATKVGP